MATEIHSNKTGTATAALDGVAKNPVWSVENPAILHASPVNLDPSSAFHALLTPTPGATFGQETGVAFTCDKLDDSGQITASGTAKVIEGAAGAVVSFSITEN